MKEWITEYLDDHRSAWADTTFKSERSRLNKLADYLDFEPKAIFEKLKSKGYKPYAIKTAFIRICDLEAWCIQRGYKTSPDFKIFMDKHRNRFKHAYVKEDLELTYEDAVIRIKGLEEPYKTQALDMLRTGLRISEVYKVRNGKVKGKGEKQRTVYGTIKQTAPRATFWRKLKSVGLKPHTLRKLCATRLGEKGATAADLCKVFGWSSIGTAFNYLEARDEKRLNELIQKASEES